MVKSRRPIRWLILLALFSGVLYLFTPVTVGPMSDYRLLYYLKETGLIVDHRTQEQILEALAADDERVQTDAIITIARRHPADPALVKALVQYIDGTASYRMKDFAIYALGELRQADVMPHLRSRADNRNYNQARLQEAIDKISGRIEKEWWKDYFLSTGAGETEK